MCTRSSAVAVRLASPMATALTGWLPTRETTLTEGFAAWTAARYSPMPRHFHSKPSKPKIGAERV